MNAVEDRETASQERAIIADGHLIASRIEELAYDLTLKGYAVLVRPPEAEGVDLVAEKGAHRRAYRFRSRFRLGNGFDEKAREEAIDRENGFTHSTVVFVTPDRRIRIEIPELNANLLAYVQAHPPAEVLSLPGSLGIAKVVVVEYDSLRIEPNSIVAEGWGVAYIPIPHPEAPAPEDWKFSIQFAVELSGDLQVKELRKVAVDVSTFDP